MTERITNFLLTFDKRSLRRELSVWEPGGTAPQIIGESPAPRSFRIGYQYDAPAAESGGVRDGEYVNLTLGAGSVRIETDHYASYPLYCHEDADTFRCSVSLRDLMASRGNGFRLDPEMLLVYFAFGYIPILDKTLYAGVTSVRPCTTIEVGTDVRVTTRPPLLLREPGSDVTLPQLADLLCEAVRRKVSLLPASESIFCLSGGHDTLLGILALKACGIRMDTATWGLTSSIDVREARLRHETLLPENRHLETILDQRKVTPSELELFSNVLGGLSTISATNLNLFTRDMIRLGRTQQLYCDHYEATRRLLKSVGEIRSKYTTPGAVVDKYFLPRAKYEAGIDAVLQRIPDRYHEDPPMEFYFYDRYVKGPIYKNALVRHFGGVKYTLPLDFRLLNANHAYIRKNGTYTYPALFEELRRRAGAAIEMPPITGSKGPEQFPFRPRAILEDNRDYFLALLDDPSSRELGALWNWKTLRDSVETGSFVENEEWFLLRLLNLLIFKKSVRIGMP